LWVAVLWWSTFHRIQDEDLLAPEADGVQQVVQKAASGTYKWATSHVLSCPRGFPDKDQSCRGAPLTGNRLCSRRREPARRAGGGVAGYRGELEGDPVRRRGLLRGPGSC